jgi:hypothetical protein
MQNRSAISRGASPPATGREPPAVNARYEGLAADL